MQKRQRLKRNWDPIPDHSQKSQNSQLSPRQTLLNCAKSLLFEIFSFLDVSAVGETYFVSHFLKNVATEYLQQTRDLYIGGEAKHAGLARLCKKLRTLTVVPAFGVKLHRQFLNRVLPANYSTFECLKGHVHGYEISMAFLSTLLSCPNLKTFRLPKCADLTDGELTAVLLATYLTHYHTLTDLELPEDLPSDIPEIWSQIPRLTNLQKLEALGNDMPYSVASQCGKLRQLHYVNIKVDSPKSLQYFQSAKTLFVRFVDSDDHHHHSPQGKTVLLLPSVVELDLDYTPVDANHPANDLQLGCPNLTTFTCTDKGANLVQTLEHVLRFSPKIASIEFVNCDNTGEELSFGHDSDSRYAKLSDRKRPELHTLFLSSIELSALTFRTITQMACNLQHVDCIVMGTVEDIIFMLWGCPHLETLDIALSGDRSTGELFFPLFTHNRLESLILQNVQQTQKLFDTVTFTKLYSLNMREGEELPIDSLPASIKVLLLSEIDGKHDIMKLAKRAQSLTYLHLSHIPWLDYTLFAWIAANPDNQLKELRVERTCKLLRNSTPPSDINLLLDFLKSCPKLTRVLLPEKWTQSLSKTQKETLKKHIPNVEKLLKRSVEWDSNDDIA